MPRHQDYLDQLLDQLGIGGFAARTAHFLVAHVLKIAIVLVVALVLSRVGAHLVHRAVRGLVSRSPLHAGSPRARQRAETIGGVIASLTRVVVWTVAVLLVIGELGFNLAPFVATATVVGAAVGFGAQSVIRDFLAGFFILVEDQYGVGDRLTVLDVTGAVEAVNLRVTRLRADDGTVWYVANGEIRKSGNSGKDWSGALVDIVLPTGTDVDAAIATMQDEAARMAAEPNWTSSLVEPPHVLGVQSTAVDSVTVRLSARTVPGAGGAVSRELRTRVTSRLHADGIVGTPTPGK